MKCSKCDQEATYDVPEPLCDNHWFDWWTEGYLEDGMMPEELETLRQEFLSSLSLGDDLQSGEPLSG